MRMLLTCVGLSTTFKDNSETESELLKKNQCIDKSELEFGKYSKSSPCMDSFVAYKVESATPLLQI